MLLCEGSVVLFLSVCFYGLNVATLSACLYVALTKSKSAETVHIYILFLSCLIKKHSIWHSPIIWYSSVFIPLPLAILTLANIH